MPNPKVISQKGWIKGLVAVMDRFNVPKGAVMKMSNLLLTNRGGLCTCDGTAIQSTLATAPGANGFIELGLFVNPTTFATTKLAALAVDATHLRIYSWIGNGDTPVALTGPGTDLSLTSGWLNPQMLIFAGGTATTGGTIITVGNNVTPYYYNGSVFAQISANTSGPGGGAAWQAKHYYGLNARIVAVDGNGNNATFQVVQVTVGSASGKFSNAAPVGGGGYSGTSTPGFNGAGITTAGDTVHDNQLIWMLIKESADYGKQTTPVGAAHAISHAGALWLWNTAPSTGDGTSGTADGPSVIRQSDINDPNSWPDANQSFVGKDDGTQGQGIASFTVAEAGIAPQGNLVLFKDYSTYLVTGVFGAQNFQITDAKTDMGCVAARSVLFATGFGIIRFSHLGFALFDGVNDRLISEEIRPYVFGRADITGVDFTKLNLASSALTTTPPMYACVLPTLDTGRYRIFCYDLVMRAWAIVDFNNADITHPITVMKQLRPPVQNGQPQGLHTYVADLAGGTATIHQWQQGDTAWSDAGAIAWSFQPPEVGDPGSRAYFRRAVLRMHAAASGILTGAFNIGAVKQPNNAQNEGGAGPSSGLAPNLTSQATYDGDQDLQASLDIGQTGPSANGTFSGTGPVTIEGVDWHVQPKQPRPSGQAF